MLTRRGAAAGIAALIGAWGPFARAIAAPNETPKAFLDAIYKNYLGKDANGVLLDKPATIRRYFAGPLAEAMIKDNAEAAKRGDAPELDGDPFVDGQDWEISGLAIKIEANGADKATAVASFKNFEDAKEVTLDLARTPAGWRIGDIRTDGRSLREMYKLK